MSDPTQIEELARTITTERMRHYGFTDEQLVRLEAFSEADHVAAGCVFDGTQWEHYDWDGSRHADLDLLDDTADCVMFVLESAALAAHDAEVRADEREKAHCESWWIDLDNGRDDRWIGPFPTFQLALWARSYLELQQTPKTFALVQRFAAARGETS